MQSNETSVKPLPVRTGEKGYCLRCPLTPCVFFARSYVNYESHLQRIHFCGDCANYCTKKSLHVCQSPGLRQGNVDAQKQLDLSDFSELSRSHLGGMLMYKYNKDISAGDIESTFQEVNSSARSFLLDLYRIHGLIKVEIGMGIKMEKEVKDEDGNIILHEAIIYFKSRHYELEWVGKIESILMNAASDLVQKKNTFLENGSGWRIKDMYSFEIKMAEMRLFRNSTGRGYLRMPFPGRKGIVNFRNNNDKCFLYCVTAAIFEDAQILLNKARYYKNTNLDKYKTWEKYFYRLNTEGVRGAVDVYKDIPKFEENNNCAVNVLTHKNDKVISMRRSSFKSKKVINLFLIQSENKQHFVLIKDLNLFLRNRNYKKVYMCDKCFRDLKSSSALLMHSCENNVSEVYETLPKKGDCLQFKRPEMTLQYPYVLYWDMETYSTPLGLKNGHNTTLNNEYKPASYSLCLVRNTISGPKIENVEYFDGPSAVHHFFERVFYYAEKVLYKIRITNNFAKPTDAELERHNNATRCDFCKKEFTTNEDDSNEDDSDEDVNDVDSPNCKKIIKVYHHCHETGNYLHTLCASCNLRVKFKNELVCISQNGTGFDHHLLLQHLDSPLFDPKDVNVISKGGEKIVQIEITGKDMYIPELKTKYNTGNEPSSKKSCGFRKVKVRFIDSYQFLSSSLSELAAGLKHENASTLSLVKESLPLIFPSMNNLEDKDSSIFFKKLPYPYSYLSSPQVLQDGHPVPSREQFYNDLKKEECSDEEWATVQTLCEKFNVTDFRQLTRIYTIIDTILLAVVWENFRQNCIKSYNLDPTFVCTAPGYSWQCFLAYTKAKIEYITDKDMLDMVTEGIRGGTSFCTRKIVTANNERSPLGYDPTKERTHIIYNDKVSLYATAMLDRYPHSNYRWEDTADLKKIDWKSYNGENETGYILKVSLRYPEKLQDETESLPLCPEKRRVEIKDLSSGQRNTMKSLGLVHSFTTQPRLLLHCDDRIEYTIHWKALKYYLCMGLQLLDIHAGFSFREVAYFKPYIEFNIAQRKVAKSESQRSLFKILNNSCFGKCLQSNKGNLQVKFCGSLADCRKLVSNPRCVDFMPITENISMVMLSPKEIVLNNIIQSGMTCLDLAKVIFYHGYYQQLQKVFPSRISTLYMDTDSCIILVTDPNNSLFKDIVKHMEFFDFSKLPKNHEIFQKFPNYPDLRTRNAGISGLWKLESLNISQLITIKAKQYSILYFDQAEELKCKGIPSATLKSFSHEKYKSVIEQNAVAHLDCTYIRSLKHKVYNVTVNKLGFHSLDVFRAYPDPSDYNFSLPFGHYRLRQYA